MGRHHDHLDTHRDHESETTSHRRASVLECGSPLPLSPALRNRWLDARPCLRIHRPAKAPEDWRTPKPCGLLNPSVGKAPPWFGDGSWCSIYRFCACIGTMNLLFGVPALAGLRTQTYRLKAELQTIRGSWSARPPPVGGESRSAFPAGLFANLLTMVAVFWHKVTRSEFLQTEHLQHQARYIGIA